MSRMVEGLTLLSLLLWELLLSCKGRRGGDLSDMLSTAKSSLSTNSKAADHNAFMCSVGIRSQDVVEGVVAVDGGEVRLRGNV